MAKSETNGKNHPLAPERANPPQVTGPHKEPPKGHPKGHTGSHTVTPRVPQTTIENPSVGIPWGFYPLPSPLNGPPNIPNITVYTRESWHDWAEWVQWLPSRGDFRLNVPKRPQMAPNGPKWLPMQPHRLIQPTAAWRADAIGVGNYPPRCRTCFLRGYGKYGASSA